jgi:DNA polymerase-3 subunit epsilon
LEFVTNGVQAAIFHATDVAIRPRPQPLAPRLTSAEMEAHRAFVATLGAGALWLRYA